MPDTRQWAAGSSDGKAISNCEPAALSGWAKALWFLFVLCIPLLGVLVYLAVRGGSMQGRAQL
ncbi:MAG TPA: PLD nuclease N-terminal domain-containing protein [Streptosporangiaceae bacterium]|nr:PLD nuclease N-terminal domain-containing protein [Streptosporangiaceae bacterium]